MKRKKGPQPPQLDLFTPLATPDANQTPKVPQKSFDTLITKCFCTFCQRIFTIETGFKYEPRTPYEIKCHHCPNTEVFVIRQEVKPKTPKK